ncbi:hypothetical protein E2320_006479, partial [Naja naja]
EKRSPEHPAEGAAGIEPANSPGVPTAAATGPRWRTPESPARFLRAKKGGKKLSGEELQRGNKIPFASALISPCDGWTAGGQRPSALQPAWKAPHPGWPDLRSLRLPLALLTQNLRPVFDEFPGRAALPGGAVRPPPLTPQHLAPRSSHSWARRAHFSRR